MKRWKNPSVAVLIASVVFVGEVISHAAHLVGERKLAGLRDLGPSEWVDSAFQGLLFVAVVEVLRLLWMFEFKYSEAFESIGEHLPLGSAGRNIHELREIIRNTRASIPIRVLDLRGDKEGIFHERMIAVSANFQKELTLLGEGYYEQLMEEGISDISINIYGTLKDHTFCTARQDHLNIFSKDIARGPLLSKANDDAAERLYKEHGREMITRLFIFDGWSDISKHYALMRNQKEHHVDVRVIFLHQIRDAGIADHNLDFGIWDNRLVMKITGSNKIPRLVVSTKAHELDRANEIRSELNKLAVSWDKFNNDLREPMNLNWGNFATEKRLLRLPPPNGPGERDLTVVLDQIRSVLTQPKKSYRLAILGLTGPILDKIAAFRVENALDVDVECVDIRAEPGEREKVRYVCKNWLEWMPGASFDAVVGDDILCNLRIWQIPLLFEKLNGALRNNGLFIVRTTINPGLSAGIDPDSMGDLLREKREALEAVWGGPDAASAARKQERETAAYELAWPLLHHARFYDAKTNEFDLGRWNLWLNQELRHTPADSAYKLHLDLKYQVRITSVLESDLRNIAEQHGFEVATNEVQSIWESDLRYKVIDPDGVIASRFKEHYKIFTFRKIESL